MLSACERPTCRRSHPDSPLCTPGGSPDGFLLLGGLTQANDGNFYGTTFFGGKCGGGVVFKMDAGGQVTLLHEFCGGTDDGLTPSAGVIKASDGNLYCSTDHAIFKISTDGKNFTAFNAFDGLAGSQILGSLVQGSDGSLYGTTVKVGLSDSELSSNSMD